MFKVSRGVTSPTPVRVQATAPPYSNEVTATPVGSPAAPTGLSATAGNGQVALSWTKPTGSITGYKLRYARTGARDSASWVAIGSSGANTESHTVTARSGDTASAGADFTAVTATTRTLAAGATRTTITVAVSDDERDESDETFTVILSEPSANATLANATATGTISDDDASPVLAAMADRTLAAGQAVDLTASATDGDGDSVSYAWMRKAGENTPALPEGTALNQARLRFTIPATATGRYTMTVTASDGNGNTDSTELTVKTTRLRLLLEGSHERALQGGATVTPALEAGLRHDGGDLGSGPGLEAGASLTWRNPRAGWLAQLRARSLLAHEKDRDEWGISALVRMEPAADGRGLSLTFGPEYGHTDSGMERWFDYRLSPATANSATQDDRESRLEAELGYGIGVSRAGAMALLTPYTGFSLGRSGAETFRVGARYRLGEGLSVGIEGKHRPQSVSENSWMLRAAIRW